LVIRALPPAADATSGELGSDLDASLRRLGLLPKADNASTKQARSHDMINDDGPAV
jgi:ribonuclease P protein component